MIVVLALYGPAFVASWLGWWAVAVAWLLVGHGLLVADVTTGPWRARQRIEYGRHWYWRPANWRRTSCRGGAG